MKTRPIILRYMTGLTCSKQNSKNYVDKTETICFYVYVYITKTQQTRFSFLMVLPQHRPLPAISPMIVPWLAAPY